MPRHPVQPKAKARADRLRGGVVLLGSLLLHLAILTALGWPIAARFLDRSNDDGAVEVTLERAHQPPRATTRLDPAAFAPRRPATSAPSLPPAIETAEVMPAASGPATTGSTGSKVAGDLGATLRRGGLACMGDLRKMLSPQEQARCDEKLGAQARNAAPLSAPIDPAKRAYYDAVAQAYADRGASGTPSPPGAAGMFDPPPSYNNGHGPRVGCSVKFGPNADKAPKGPANALRAGPCFIQPPVGSLTPEADIRKPY